MNTKKQGDIGLGAAIAYFTSLGATVNIPLTDSQEYDLVIDYQGILNRVQVKRTTFKRNGNYIVSLTIKGGNRTSSGKIKRFNPAKVDSIFVLTGENKTYLIPTKSLGDKQSLRINKKNEIFRVYVGDGEPR